MERPVDVPKLPAHGPGTRGVAANERAFARGPLIWILGTLLLVAVVAGGLWAAGSGRDTLDAGEIAAGDDAEAEELPRFSAPLLAGGEISSADITGPGMILVYASWCPSCNAAAPGVAEFQQANPDIAPYYLNVADEPGAAAEFLSRHDLADGPVISDPDRRVEDAFGLVGQPHAIFVDADGSVAAVVQGPTGADDLQRVADSLEAA